MGVLTGTCFYLINIHTTQCNWVVSQFAMIVGVSWNWKWIHSTRSVSALLSHCSLCLGHGTLRQHVSMLTYSLEHAGALSEGSQSLWTSLFLFWLCIITHIVCSTLWPHSPSALLSKGAATQWPGGRGVGGGGVLENRNSVLRHLKTQRSPVDVKNPPQPLNHWFWQDAPLPLLLLLRELAVTYVWTHTVTSSWACPAAGQRSEVQVPEGSTDRRLSGLRWIRINCHSSSGT